MGAGIAGLGLSLRGVAQAESKANYNVLNFYNWDTYIGDTTLIDFQKETNIQVKLTIIENENSVKSSLESNNQGFDVVVLSDYLLDPMLRKSLLHPINIDKIPNYRHNIRPDFQQKDIDKNPLFSVPYFWGTTGIGYRKSKVKTLPSWKELFDSDQYKNRIALMNDAVVLRFIGKYLGFGLNNADKRKIDQCAELLLKQLPNIKLFHDDNGEALLSVGEVDLVLEYSGDIAQIMQDDRDINFVIPDSGSEVWYDGLAIPKEAPRIDLAHNFINYVLDAEVMAKIIHTVHYASLNRAAVNLTEKNYRNNQVIFPSSEALKNCEKKYFISEDIENYYQKTWNEIVERKINHKA